MTMVLAGEPNLLFAQFGATAVHDDRGFRPKVFVCDVAISASANKSPYSRHLLISSSGTSREDPVRYDSRLPEYFDTFRISGSLWRFIRLCQVQVAFIRESPSHFVRGVVWWIDSMYLHYPAWCPLFVSFVDGVGAWLVSQVLLLVFENRAISSNCGKKGRSAKMLRDYDAVPKVFDARRYGQLV
jgi:hypothetical protein